MAAFDHHMKIAVALSKVPANNTINRCVLSQLNLFVEDTSEQDIFGRRVDGLFNDSLIDTGVTRKDDNTPLGNR